MCRFKEGVKEACKKPARAADHLIANTFTDEEAYLLAQKFFNEMVGYNVSSAQKFAERLEKRGLILACH